MIFSIFFMDVVQATHPVAKLLGTFWTASGQVSAQTRSRKPVQKAPKARFVKLLGGLWKASGQVSAQTCSRRPAQKAQEARFVKLLGGFWKASGQVSAQARSRRPVLVAAAGGSPLPGYS